MGRWGDCYGEAVNGPPPDEIDAEEDVASPDDGFGGGTEASQ